MQKRWDDILDMSDHAKARIEQAEQKATAATADENAKEIRSETDDEVCTLTSIPERSSTAIKTETPHTKIAPPEMNIQLQR